MKNYSYDKYSDSLIVSNKREGEEIKENFEVGDMIFSLNEKGEIMGLEIRGFSFFLEEAGLDSEMLNDLDSINLKIIPKKDTILISLNIETKHKNKIAICRDIPQLVNLYV